MLVYQRVFPQGAPFVIEAIRNIQTAPRIHLKKERDVRQVHEIEAASAELNFCKKKKKDEKGQG